MPPSLSQKIHDALPQAENIDGICFRNVAFKRATKSQALSTARSLITGGRYNPIREFGTLYLSLDPHTSLEEVSQAQSLSAIRIAPRFPRVDLSVKVRLSKILNLTNPAIQHALGITETDLKGTDWYNIQESGRVALTQLIGRFARDAGFEALLVPSAKFPGKNLDIFYPDKLLPTSKVSLINEDQFPD